MRRNPSVPPLLLCLVLVPAAWSAGADQGDSPSAEQEKPFRIWNDSSGRFQVEAALVDFAEGAVRLEKRDGSLISVPADQLSRDDRTWLQRELVRRRRAQRSEAVPAGTPTDAAPLEGERPEPAAAADWPGWRGPNRDGKSPDTGLLAQWPEGGPPLLWHAERIGKGYSSVAVVDGRVYTTGVIGERLVISAFDMEGNRVGQVPHDLAWTRNYPGGRSTPMIDGGRLYLISGHGLVGCYDAKSLAKIWSVHMRDFGGTAPEWGYAESVLILGPLAVFTPGGSKCIVALNKQTGRPVWSSGPFEAGAQYGSCFAFEFEGVPIVAAGTHNGLVGVDGRSGQVLFSNPHAAGNTANCPTPVADDGRLFWAAGYGQGGICMKLAAGRGRISAEVDWTTGDMVCQHGGYIVHEGHVYGSNDQGWACIELATGATKWKERAVGKGSLCFADGMLYLFAENGGRAALATCSPEGLEVRGEMAVEGEGTSWAHPVVIGRRLYLRYDDNLYCFDVAAP